MTEEEKKLRDELIELKQKYRKLKQKYEVVSDELLRYYIKYGKEGLYDNKRGSNKTKI